MRSTSKVLPSMAAALVLASLSAPAALAQWTIQPSPNPEGAPVAELDSVSCTSDGSCMAVGYYSPNGTVEQTLAERWDGSSWTILSTPNRPGGADILSGVSCAAPESCVAVGLYVTTTSVRALAETWDGHAWIIRHTPSPAARAVVNLRSVSCSAPDSCVAVGGFTREREEAEEQPLAESWNGAHWALQAVPNPEAENGSGLQAVSCSGPEACTATGDYDYADIDQSIFAMRLSGGSWTMQRQPNPGGEEYNAENAVSCAQASACTAVGSWFTSKLETRPLVESWNGAKWSRQHARRPKGAVSAALEGVSCLGGSSCTAVGTWTASEYGNPSLTLAEGWNGEGWTLQETPNPAGSQLSTLAAVDCSTGTCVAVGSYWNGSITQTLAERDPGP